MEHTGVIFDLDGTVVDNIRHHYLAFKELASRRGMDFSWEDYVRVNGRRNREIFAGLFPGEPVEQHETLADEKEAIYRQLYETDLTPMPGLIALLDDLRKHKIPVALATMAPVENVTFVLSAAKLSAYFPTVITARDVHHSKPHPEIFLKAATSLRLKPQQCIVFEDSPIGVQAARRAGMRVIGVTTTASDLDADLLVKDYVGLNAEKLQSLTPRQ